MVVQRWSGYREGQQGVITKGTGNSCGDTFAHCLGCGDGDVRAYQIVHFKYIQFIIYRYFKKVTKTFFKNSLRIVHVMYVNLASTNRRKRKERNCIPDPVSQPHPGPTGPFFLTWRTTPHPQRICVNQRSAAQLAHWGLRASLQQICSILHSPAQTPPPPPGSHLALCHTLPAQGSQDPWLKPLS